MQTEKHLWQMASTFHHPFMAWNFLVKKFAMPTVKRLRHMYVRAPLFLRVSIGNKVGCNMDQIEPQRLGFWSLALKLMDLDSIKVFAF